MEPTVSRNETPEARDESEPRIVSTSSTCSGKPRVVSHHIKVADVAIRYERMGMTPDEIVSTWPSSTLSDAHAALTYSYDYRERIDADIREGEELADKVRAGQPSDFEKVRQWSADAVNDPLPS